jgi:PKD repeat protein
MPDSLAFAGSYTVNSNQVCRPNTPPTAVLNASPTSGFAPLTVTFDGSGSSDPDTAPPPDTIASYTFNFGDGNSTTTQAPTATAQHQYANPGTYTASLTVTDSRGASSTNSATKTITVNGQPDLVVSALTSTPSQPKHGTTATITATVKNQGNASAGASQTQFRDGTTSLGLINTVSLTPGQSVQVSVKWTTPNKKGAHTISATADKNNAVAESNESNNTRSITVNVQ